MSRGQRTALILIVLLIIGFIAPGYTKEKKPFQKSGLISSYPSCGVVTKGIAYDDQYLWVSVFDPKPRIYKINSETGQIITSIPSPGPNPAGLVSDGNFLWNIDLNRTDPLVGPLVYQLSLKDGKTISSFPTPGIASESHPIDLAWDGKSLWCIDEGVNMIYALSPLDWMFTSNEQKSM